jgi:plasmid stabilization system protein ParE
VPRELSFTDKAVADLAAIAHWLTQPGAGRTAQRRSQSIWHAIADIRDGPCRFPVGEHPGIRELSRAGYRVLYRVEPDNGRNETAGDVRIMRVFGPGQRRDYI